MEESKEVYVKLEVLPDGKVNVKVSNLNPLDVISLCNVAIKKALEQIQVKEKSNIIKPTLNEAMGANRLKH